jgi:F-type H+-transporting ATPase subunit b
MELVTPGLGLMFWMLVSFSILLFILTKFAWKPILKMLEERQKSIDDALTGAKQAREEAKKIREQNELLLQEAMQQRIELLKDARKLEETIVNDAKKEAETQANRILASAREAIEKEKLAAIGEMKNKITELSVLIAEKILKQQLENNQKQKDLISSTLTDLKLN